MQVLLNFVVAIQMLAALIMIGLVLVQHGKGADMGASFGSGSSGSLFGATGSANFLSRSTAVCAAVFFVCTLTLAYFSHERASASPSSNSTILDRAPGIAASAPAGGASGVASGASAPADAASAVVVPAAPVQAASGAGAIPTK